MFAPWLNTDIINDKSIYSGAREMVPLIFIKLVSPWGA